MKFIRKAWDWLVRYMSMMDYTLDDYMLDRMRGLEREVEQLKGEKGRTSAYEPSTTDSNQTR
jgi:hypothetical protein